MKISTKGRYALRMLVDMAQQPDGYVPLKDVAQRQDISKKYLEQIALVLSQAGILKGARGHQGGYRLIGKPEDYTLQRILTVMEGSLAPVACLEQTDEKCAHCHECATLPVWIGLEKLIADYLSGITLQDLLDGKVNAE